MRGKFRYWLRFDGDDIAPRACAIFVPKTKKTGRASRGPSGPRRRMKCGNVESEAVYETDWVGIFVCCFVFARDAIPSGWGSLRCSEKDEIVVGWMDGREGGARKASKNR